MAAKPDQPAAAKGNPVTIIIGPAIGSQPPSVRLASTVGPGNVRSLVPSGQTVPGTVLIGLPQSNTSSAGGHTCTAVDLKKTTGSTTQQRPPTDSNAPPSTPTSTTARRMVTRSRGKLQQDKSSKSRKRKLPAGSNRPAPKKGTGAKKGMTLPVVKIKKLSVSGSGTITLDSPKKRVSPSVDTNPVIPKVPAGDGFKAFDIRVRHTPSESLPKRKALNQDDYSYYGTKEVNELKERMRKDESDIKRLKKNQRKFRMQVFRANLKHRVLMKSLLLEQKLHKEAKQTLKAIKQGLQIEVATVDPEA